MYKDGFSDFEIKNGMIKFNDESEAQPIGCVGSFEETMNKKEISKKCEGVIEKTVVKGDGTGELKVSLHIKYAAFVKGFGMDLKTLKDGVYAYGRNSVHRHFTYTSDVFDEEGDRKLKAYPNCVFTDFIARKIENGAEEVAEVEGTIKVSPDEYGNGMYEAIASNVDENITNQWLENFTPELVKLIQV